MRDTLFAIPGVSKVDVNFNRKTVKVSFDSSKVSPDDLTRTLADRSGGRYTATVVP